MRNAQDHNAAISMAISIVSLPRPSPVRSQIFKWLEKSIQEQELPHHSNLEEIASTGLRKIEKNQEIKRKADFNTEERRVGEEWVSPWRTRRWTYHYNKKQQ